MLKSQIMFVKRWLDISRNMKTAFNTSQSLSSPRGTSVARKKKSSGIYRFFLRLTHHNDDLACIVVAIFFFVAMMMFFAVFAAGIYTLSPLDNRANQRVAAQPRRLTSPLSMMLSRFTSSVKTIRRRRPRGLRFFDYWQDEEHEDFEPYPWKFMKRHSSSSKKEASVMGPPSELKDQEHPSSKHQNIDARSFMDDESFVPTLPSGDKDHDHEEYYFNDRSDFYAQLRRSFESYFPPPLSKNLPTKQDPSAKRCLQAVEDLQTYTNLQTHLLPTNSDNPSNNKSNQIYYDIHDCPEQPPPGYPVEWNLVHEVLSQWPADDPELPASGKLYQGLCVFDLQVEGNLAKALNYRNAELPFVVKGDPMVAQTVERWNAPYYLSTLIGDTPQGTETSASGKFTYWTGRGVDNVKYPMDGPDYKPPTVLSEMTFEEWLKLANVTDSQLLTPESPHYYFRVVGCAPGKATNHRNTPETVHKVDNSCSMLAGNAPHVPYLADELPFYAQTKQSLYIKEPLSEMTGSRASSKALNCRFGMKGVMATNHFDGERNFVTVLSGERRYVLAHPEQCGNMALFPYGHPSARHSAIDWANPDLEEFPEFEKAKGNEVVLQAGDSLFLPSLWFHYIVSMSMNVQCNTRSGMDQRNVKALDESCGW